MSANTEQIKKMLERTGTTNLSQKPNVDLDKERLQLEGTYLQQNRSKFVFPKFLYARTTNNKTIDVSYVPQSMDAIEYIRSDSLQQGMPDKETILRICKLHKAWSIMAPWENVEDFVTTNWNSENIV